MAHGLAADAVVLLHFGFILFGMFGAFLALRWLWIAWVHLPAVAWAVWVELSGRVCPLTPLENWFRRAAGQGGYAGDFIERYIAHLIYPEGLTRDLQLMLAAGLIVLNGAIYALVWRRHRGQARRTDVGRRTRKASRA